jgi:hypothetical protein
MLRTLDFIIFAIFYIDNSQAMLRVLGPAWGRSAAQ